MSIFSKLGALIFAPTDAAGNPRQVINHDAQVWSTEVERIIQVALEGGDLLVYSSLSALNADLDHPAHTGAILIGESIADDGLYMKQGASGSGSWGKIGNVPGQGFVKATNAGAGTANAIEATTPVAVNETQLILLPITAANTASPVTVAFNGGAALTVKTVSGNDMSVAGLPASSVILGVIQGSNFRLLSDQASAAIQAAAEAAQAAAEQARDEAVSAASSVQSTLSSKTFAEANYHPTTWPDFIETAGYAAAGDGGGAFYKKVASEPSHDGKMSITLSDAVTVVWYELVSLVINPRMFGAVGDGVADDTAALQSCANFMCLFGGRGEGIPTDKYSITSTITFKPQVSAGYSPPYNPPSDIIFDLVDKSLIDIDLQGALVVADAAMDSMFELVFSAASPNEVAPFFIRVHRGRFNGAGNATIGIHSNWCLGSDIDHNLIWGVARGIKTEGYGLHTVSKNVIRFTTCGIDMTAGGADSLFQQNDFYTASGAVSGAACFLLGNDEASWPGQTRIFSNAATNEGQGTAYFVKVEASVSANVVRNVNVLDNGVTGFDRLIYARGKSGSYNLRYWVVRGNNTLDYDAKTTLGLIDTTETEGWLIDGNFFNPTWSGTRSPYSCIQMVNSVRDRISGNYITMCSASGIRVDFANRAEVTGNKILNCGDATNAAIGLASSSQRNLVYGNTIDNNDTTNFCQIAIAEGTGGDWNAGSLNMINNVNTKYSTVGANTVVT